MQINAAQVLGCWPLIQRLAGHPLWRWHRVGTKIMCAGWLCKPVLCIRLPGLVVKGYTRNMSDTDLDSLAVVGCVDSGGMMVQMLLQ